MGYGAAIGGVLGALGSVAGPLLEKGPDTKSSVYTADPGTDVNPALQIAQFNHLLGQGIFDPTQLLRASPVNQLIGEITSSLSQGVGWKGMTLREMRQVLEFFNNGGDMSGYKGNNKIRLQSLLDRVVAFTGYSNLNDLFAAETQFKQQIEPILASGRDAAAGGMQATINVQRQIRNLITGLPDASAAGIASLKEQEKTRLLRELNRGVDEQRGDLLELANSGNFNPGRPLGDLEEFRSRATQDADLEALSRALALIGGQQNVAGANLSMLYGNQNQAFNQAMSLAAADQGLVGSQVQTAGGSAGGGNPGLATGVSAAGNSLGNGLLGYALLSQNNNTRPNEYGGYGNSAYGPALPPGY